MMNSFVWNATNACLINLVSREIITRYQTKKDTEVLKKMVRPIVKIKEMKNEEWVVWSLTDSP